MDFNQTLKARYSCRAFLEKPVSAKQVKDIIAKAQAAPSWGNTQPWKAYAVAGKAAEAIREDLVSAFNAREPEEPDIAMPPGFEGELKKRYGEVGKGIFASFGVERADKKQRLAHAARNRRAFSAPVLLFVTVPKQMTSYALFDAGAFVSHICLAAADMGLATCILAALVRHAGVVRRRLSIADGEDIVIGVALGYADESQNAARFRSSRAELGEVLGMTGF